VQDLTAPIMEEIVAMSMERINEFGPTDIASLMRSLVLVDYKLTKEDWTTIFRRMMLIASVFEASATSMFLWGVAMLGGTPDFKLREEIKLRIPVNAAAFSFYECGDLIWACSVLDIQLDPVVWSAIWKSAERGVTDCDATSLSNLMFAHGSWRTKPEQGLLDAAKERIPEVLPQIEATELANLAWAMGVLGVESPEALTQAQQKNDEQPTKFPCYCINPKEVRLCLSVPSVRMRGCVCVCEGVQC
jgi:hypothetical protein